MEKENRLYSISLGVASLQGGSVGVATALSPATCRPFQVFSPSFFVGLGLTRGRKLLNEANTVAALEWTSVSTAVCEMSCEETSFYERLFLVEGRSLGCSMPDLVVSF